MKRRWRSKSRKSARPGPSHRSGESISPCRSGETAASSDRSGGRAFSASAAPDREGGDERMQRRRREHEHPDKRLSSMVENDHSDEIGVHAIGDRKQEQGREVRNVQALLDMNDHTIGEKIYDCLSQLNYDPPEDPFDWSEYEPEQLIELHQRLALYRVRGYDYEVEYEDWNCYKSTLHTYEQDLAYIKYCEAIEKETEWIADYHVGSSMPWERVKNVAYIQSLKVGASFPNVYPSLVMSGFEEHMWSVV